MILVTLNFTHYSQKDSATGIRELIVAEDFAQAEAYIEKSEFSGNFHEYDEEDADDSTFFPDDEWKAANQGRLDQLVEFSLAFGLTVDEYGAIEGPGGSLTKFLRGDFWREVSDTYYGFTHLDWSDVKEISPEDAGTLLRLGLAVDAAKELADDAE